MKKLLLISSIALAGVLSNAQTLVQDNFDSYTVGNVGTQTNGSAPGQGGWITTSAGTPPNLNNTNYQIVAVAGKGNVLSVLGSDTAVGTKFAHKNTTFSGAWAARDEFNDILKAEFDVYTGDVTTSNNGIQLALVGMGTDNTSKTLVGFTMHAATRRAAVTANILPCDIFGAPYCTSSYPAGNYVLSYNDTAANPLFYPANTWLKVGMAWDMNTGEVFFKVIGPDGTEYINDSFPGAAVAANPTQANIIISALQSNTYTTNTVAANGMFDNINYMASDNADILAVGDVNNVKATVTLFPNPTADFINFVSKSKVQSAQIFDMSGKAINAQITDNKVDVRDLGKGTYVIKLQTAEGTTTQKFIKK